RLGPRLDSSLDKSLDKGQAKPYAILPMHRCVGAPRLDQDWTKPQHSWRMFYIRSYLSYYEDRSHACKRRHAPSSHRSFSHCVLDLGQHRGLALSHAVAACGVADADLVAAALGLDRRGRGCPDGAVSPEQAAAAS